MSASPSRGAPSTPGTTAPTGVLGGEWFSLSRAGDATQVSGQTGTQKPPAGIVSSDWVDAAKSADQEELKRNVDEVFKPTVLEVTGSEGHQSVPPCIMRCGKPGNALPTPAGCACEDCIVKHIFELDTKSPRIREGWMHVSELNDALGQANLSPLLKPVFA